MTPCSSLPIASPSRFTFRVNGASVAEKVISAFRGASSLPPLGSSGASWQWSRHARARLRPHGHVSQASRVACGREPGGLPRARGRTAASELRDVDRICKLYGWSQTFSTTASNRTG